MRNHLDAEWVPNADVIESEACLLIRLEIAGVERESIQVIATHLALIVSGRRGNPTAGGTQAGFRYHQMEIEYGPFERVLPLPFAVDPSAGRARLHHGLLEIELPRARATSKQKTLIAIKW